VSYQALILDFSGVLTVGMREAGRDFCVRSGLEPDAYHQAMQTDPVGQRLCTGRTGRDRPGRSAGRPWPSVTWGRTFPGRAASIAEAGPSWRRSWSAGQ